MPQTNYYLLLPHPTEPRLLLLTHADSYVLPHFTADDTHFWQSVAHINQRVNQLWGITVTTLRCMRTEWLEDKRNRYYALENHSPDWEMPAAARWATREELDGLTLAEPDQRATIEDWFTFYSNLDTIQTPWYTPGWYGEMRAWLDGQLEERGITPTAPVEQLRSWERSTILRSQTEQGAIYFKALPPMFRHEPLLVKWLSHHFPQEFPKPLMVDGWRGWLLMPDYGSKTLDAVPDTERWVAALRAFAQLQARLSVRGNELIGLGCPDRRLYTLEQQIEALLNTPASQLSGDSLKLNDDEMETLRARIPEFKEKCKALASYSIPASLEHGDFWAGQVVVNEDQFVFIDWSDSSISHPFFSMYFLMDDDLAQPRDQLRDAYLREWIAYEPFETLREAFEIAMQLAPLHHALIYQHHILPQMQIKWEMQNMIPFYLRRLLP